jgi:hypothetical protein
MTAFKFEWDEAKSLKNKKKHGITFEEARSVFYDENALLISDPDHSEAEDRFILLGLSAALRILVVCHCYRETNDTIRIISARRADKRESAGYRQR